MMREFGAPSSGTSAPRQSGASRPPRRPDTPSRSTAGTLSRPRRCALRQPIGSAAARPAPPAADGPAWPGSTPEAAKSGASAGSGCDGSNCSRVGSARLAQRLRRQQVAAEPSAMTGCPGSTGRCSTAAARIGASSSTGGSAASEPNSARPRGPAVSAASSTSGLSPVSSTGVPRRRSAAARWTVRRLRTVGSGRPRRAPSRSPPVRRARVSSQCTKMEQCRPNLVTIHDIPAPHRPVRPHTPAV